MQAIFKWAEGKPSTRVTRIEPKQFYASERTFLTWLNMAATIGSIGVAMIAVSTDDNGNTSKLAYLSYAFILLAAIFIIYAVSVFLWRRKTIRRKEDGNYDDPYGPMALAATLMCIYFSVFGMGVSKLANNATFMAWLSLPTEI